MLCQDAALHCGSSMGKGSTRHNRSKCCKGTATQQRCGRVGETSNVVQYSQVKLEHTILVMYATHFSLEKYCIFYHIYNSYCLQISFSSDVSIVDSFISLIITSFIHPNSLFRLDMNWLDSYYFHISKAISIPR